MNIMLSASAAHLLLLLLSTAVAAEVNITLFTKDQGLSKRVEITNVTELQLSCETESSGNDSDISGLWITGGDRMDAAVQTREGKRYLWRTVNATKPENVTCVFLSGETVIASASFLLQVPAMQDMSEKPIISYIGDSVTLTCHIQPQPTGWNWYRFNGTEKVMINVTSETRYTVHDDNQKDVKESKLCVTGLSEADNGTYTCEALYAVGSAHGEVHLKVISFTEPLKPFFAILVEVVVLVSLILAYEWKGKRRSHSYTVTSEEPGEQQIIEDGKQEESNGMYDTTTRQRKV